MTGLTTAGELLDLVPALSGVAVADRLHAGVERLDDLPPDDRATVELARLAAAGGLTLSPPRAAAVVEVLAAQLNVPMRPSASTALAGDVDGAINRLLADLYRRVRALPAPARHEVYQRVSRRTKRHVTALERLPVGDLGALVDFVTGLEQLYKPETASAEPSRSDVEPSGTPGPDAGGDGPGVSNPPEDAASPAGANGTAR